MNAQTLLAKLNNTALSPELVGEVIKMQANMAPSDRQKSEVRLVRTLQLLGDKGFTRRKSTDTAMAIEFRMMALARLLEDAAVRGWSLPGNEPGLTYVHPDLMHAAAEEPLIETADLQVAFDPESFRNRVLAVAEVEGHG